MLRPEQIWKVALLLSIVFSLSIFAIDVFTPRGHAVQILYILPVLATLWSPNWKSTAGVAVLCTGLTVFGYFVSPEHELAQSMIAFSLSLPNRLYVVAIIWAGTIISVQRKHVRQALEELNVQLEHRVEERTAELKKANAHLHQEVHDRRKAEEELRRSNEELEQFAAVASHDLQAPLRGISSFLQLLERNYKSQLNSTGQEYINYAVQQSGQMKVLIDDLLEVAKIRTKGKPFTTVDCNRALSRALDRLHADIRQSNSTVTNDELPTITADNGQIVQLFQNLIGNAVKYRGEQASQIHVSVAGKEDHWLFSVRDNGIGISTNSTKRIFDLFQRAHSAEQYEGTGVGLAICQRIVHRHGGRIWVESEVGQGSTFYFTLPMKTAVNDTREHD